MIYILLPVHNRLKTTERFINCLLDQTYANYHLILIDDGSTDDTAEMAKNKIEKLTIIKGNGNWWWAGSLQQGYNWMKSQLLNNDDIALIINDDTTFVNDFLAIGQALSVQHPNTLLLAQNYSIEDNQLIDSGLHVDLKKIIFQQAKSQNEINCLSTRGLFLRANDFIALGGFYQKILPHYLSDYEFTIRAYRKGMLLMTDPNLKLWSEKGPGGYYKWGQEKSLLEFLRNYFSKRSMINPIFWTSFVLLSCPWPYKLRNILKIWKNASVIIFHILSKRRRKDVG